MIRSTRPKSQSDQRATEACQQASDWARVRRRPHFPQSSPVACGTMRCDLTGPDLDARGSVRLGSTTATRTTSVVVVVGCQRNRDVNGEPVAAPVTADTECRTGEGRWPGASETHTPRTLTRSSRPNALAVRAMPKRYSRTDQTRNVPVAGPADTSGQQRGHAPSRTHNTTACLVPGLPIPHRTPTRSPTKGTTSNGDSQRVVLFS